MAGNQRHRDRSLIGLAFFTFCRLQRNEQLWRGAGVADCRLKRRQAEELIISPALHVLLWTSTVLRGRRAVLVHAGWYPAVTRGGLFRDDFTAGLVQVWEPQPPKAPLGRYTAPSPPIPLPAANFTDGTLLAVLCESHGQELFPAAWSATSASAG